MLVEVLGTVDSFWLSVRVVRTLDSKSKDRGFESYLSFLAER